MTGQFATARRGLENIDISFVAARLKRGDSVAAVARMAGVSLPGLQKLMETLKIETRKDTPAPVLVLPAPRTPPLWRQSLPPKARAAIQAVAAAHGLTYGELTLPHQFRGSAAVCLARHEAYHAVRSIKTAAGEPVFSYPQIGAFFGGRDHSTIIHGVQAHEQRLKATKTWEEWRAGK
jgi:hypothetical protein